MSKVKLPKHVAGVKIPKPFRAAAEAALAELASPAGRALIAGALIAAATALTREPAPEAEADGEGAKEPALGGKPEPSQGGKPPVDFGALLGLAATTAMRGLRAANERPEGGTPPRDWIRP